MITRELFGSLALVVVVAGCAPGERAAERVDETVPAAEADMADEGGAVSEESDAAAEPAAGAPELDSPDAAPAGPGAVAPAGEVDTRVGRNWVLLEFSRPVEEGDVEWLEANGFRVDSVMGELRVRGWLEEGAQRVVIANDPRIARIHTQMR